MVSSNPFTRKGFQSVSTSIDANACLSSISFRNDFVISLLEENVSYILEGQQTSCVMSVAAAPLNPYQPNHRMKQPSAPSVSECPGIARGVFFPVFGSVIYLPIRGPDSRTDNGGYAADHMDSGRTGKIYVSQLSKPAAAISDPTSLNRINEQTDYGTVNTVGAELGTLRHSTGHNGRSSGAEYQIKDE